MKCISLLLLSALPLAGIAQGGELKLKGSISIPAVKWVQVSFRSGTDKVRDSIRVEKGTYKYKRPLAEPVLATVTYLSDSVLVRKGERSSNSYAFPVFLEPGSSIEIRTTDSVQNNRVSGSTAHTQYLALNDQTKEYDKIEEPYVAAFYQASKAQNKTEAARIEHQIDSIDAVMREKVYGGFLQSNPGSPVALYALREYAGYYLDPAKVTPLFARLSQSAQKSPSGVAFSAELDKARLTAVGNVAPDFVMNDTLDHPLSLSSLRGKYVLVDFWASWCGPCRRENPNVVKAFQAYQGKNFTILGVSLDRPGKKENWLKAIHDDGLTWNHVSDLQWWDNAAAKQYGIQAIPANLLLDPEGKIIAKNLSGDELQSKLAEVLH
ncbi:peroxiredoxin family protein [Flaviaesturariibacter aridisoli]|uniref:AhpC/TSA family protein n=1 Tax=Flaviaesturariibacter aridisoli TaxID=2545761 RepID=A0A4R4E3Z5_9BACT|nr:TlpA disulfide reductase family protein [Flaviaesturariibacter aridisoli]TCZ73657.1 AhpC/TSA family protein [Flaviaesturariibacter aridisoli]